eukprot:GEMP01001290.1.p1 GENE.GEMP01001290.1~~GEMP01001290.1.p1  ORF type:complete len:1594 (+),score=356.04 GEMP01001290.1:270-5051(+)
MSIDVVDENLSYGQNNRVPIVMEDENLNCSGTNAEVPLKKDAECDDAGERESFFTIRCPSGEPFSQQSCALPPRPGVWGDTPAPFTFFTRKTLIEKQAIFKDILSWEDKTVFVPPTELGVIFLHEFLTSKLIGPVFEQIGHCVSTEGSPTRISVRSPYWMLRRLKAGFHRDFKQIVIDDGTFWHPEIASELFPLLDHLQKRSGKYRRSDLPTTPEGQRRADAATVRIVVIVDERCAWPFPWWQEHWEHHVSKSTQNLRAVPNNKLEYESWSYQDGKANDENNGDYQEYDLPDNMEVASRAPSDASVYSTHSPRSTPDDAFDTQSDCDRGYRQIFLDSLTSDVVRQVAHELGVTELNLTPSDAVKLCSAALCKLLADPCTHNQYVRPGFFALVFLPTAMDALQCKQEFDRVTPITPFAPPLCAIRFRLLNDLPTFAHQVYQIRNADVARNATTSCEHPYTVIFSSSIGEQLRLPFINMIIDCGVDEHDPCSWYAPYRQRARTVVLEDSIDMHVVDKMHPGDANFNENTTTQGASSPPASTHNDSDSTLDDDDDFSDDTQASSDNGGRRRRERRVGRRAHEQQVEDFWRQMVNENEEQVDDIAKQKCRRQKCRLDKWSWAKEHKWKSQWLDYRQSYKALRAHTSRLILHLYYTNTPLAPVVLPIEEPMKNRLVQENEEGETEEGETEEDELDPVDVLAKETGLCPQAAKIVWAGILFNCLPSCLVIAAALDVKQTVDMWCHALPKDNFTSADYEFLYKLTAIMKAIDLHHRGDLEFYRNIFIDYLGRIRSHHRSWISPTNLGPIIDVMNPIFIDKWFSVVSGLVTFLRPCFHFTETLEFFNEHQWEAFSAVSPTEFRVSRVDEGSKKKGDVLRDWYGDQDNFDGENDADASAEQDGPQEPMVRVGMNIENIPTKFPAVVTFTQKDEMGEKLIDFLGILEKTTKTPGSVTHSNLLRFFPREEPMLLPALTYALGQVAVALNPHNLLEYSSRIVEHRKVCGLTHDYRIFRVDGCDREDLAKLLPLLRDVAPSADKVDVRPEKDSAHVSREDAAHVPLSLLEDFHVSEESHTSHARLAFYEEEHIEVSPVVVGSTHIICPEGHAMQKLEVFPFQGQIFRCHCHNEKAHTSSTKINEPPFYYCTFCLNVYGYCLACSELPAITGLVTPAYQPNQIIVHPNLAMLKIGAKPFSPADNSIARVQITHPWQINWYVPHQNDLIRAGRATVKYTVSHLSSAWWLCSEEAPATQLCLFTRMSSDNDTRMPSDNSDETSTLHDVVMLPVSDDQRAILWTLAFHAHPLGVECMFEDVGRTTSSVEKNTKPNIIGFASHDTHVCFSHRPIPYSALDGPKAVRRELRSIKSAKLGWYKCTLDLASFVSVHKLTLDKLRKATLPSFKLPKISPDITKVPTVGRIARLLPVGDDGESQFADPGMGIRVDLAKWVRNDGDARLPSDDAVCADRKEPVVKSWNNDRGGDDIEPFPCRALASYAAEDHLSFHDGDLIICEETTASGWAFGYVYSLTAHIGSRSKCYPASYCSRITQTMRAVATFRRGDVAYDFPTLELAEGDEVVVCGEDKEGWTLGFRRNMLGYFPTHFCTA